MEQMNQLPRAVFDFLDRPRVSPLLESIGPTCKIFLSLEPGNY